MAVLLLSFTNLVLPMLRKVNKGKLKVILYLVYSTHSTEPNIDAPDFVIHCSYQSDLVSPW